MNSVPTAAGVLASPGCDLSEQQPEARTGGTKLARGRHREVELECVGEEEDAVDGRVALEIDEFDGTHLIDERVCPVSEYRGDRRRLSDAERQVQVREAVALVHREGSDGGSADDPVIILAQTQHAITQAVSPVNGEHGSSPSVRRRPDPTTLTLATVCRPMRRPGRRLRSMFAHGSWLSKWGRPTRPRRRGRLGLGAVGVMRGLAVTLSVRGEFNDDG